MKRFLSVISFIIVTAVVLSVCTVSSFASEATAPYASLGQSIYSTEDKNYTVELPIELDGYIDEGEGWVCVTPDFVNKSVAEAEYRFDSWKSNIDIAILDNEAEKEYSSNFKYYVAQSETDVYIGIVDYAPYFENDDSYGFSKACESLTRNIYGIRIGFDPSDYSNALYIREVNGIDQLNMVTKNSYISLADLELTDAFSYAFAKYDNALSTVIAQANNLSVNAHHWSTPAHQWIAHVEMKINKEMIKEAYASAYGESVAANIDFETIYLSASAAACRPNPGESNSYSFSYPVYGTIVSAETATANSLPSRYIPDMIVFEKPVEETTPEPATEAPSDDVNTDAENTEANAESNDTVTEPTGSCGGVVSFAGVALIAAFGVCAASFSKRKED